jgi:hypothetical protein
LILGMGGDTAIDTAEEPKARPSLQRGRVSATE